MGIEVLFILIAFGMPLFFLWRRVFARWRTLQKVNIFAATVAAVISALFLYVAIGATWFFIISYYPHREFNREAWLTNPEKRYELSKSIINSGILIGKTKAEVGEILGTGSHAGAENRWYYYLGFKPSLIGIDPDVLDIEFKDEKVIKVEQHET